MKTETTTLIQNVLLAQIVFVKLLPCTNPYALWQMHTATESFLFANQKNNKKNPTDSSAIARKDVHFNEIKSTSMVYAVWKMDVNNFVWGVRRGRVRECMHIICACISHLHSEFWSIFIQSKTENHELIAYIFIFKQIHCWQFGVFLCVCVCVGFIWLQYKTSYYNITAWKCCVLLLLFCVCVCVGILILPDKTDSSRAFHTCK